MLSNIVLFYTFSVYTLCYCDNHYNSEDEYLPVLFHMDNYEDCMLLEDKAFFCSFTFQLQPIYSNGSLSKIWKHIEKLNRSPYSYKYDNLRHSICVPKTCPNISKTYDTDPVLHYKLTNCYNKKFQNLDLRGTVTKIRCETNEAKYPKDWWDTTVANLFMYYVLFIVTVSLYEWIFRDTRDKLPMETPTWKAILAAFSLPRNWNRLKTVHITPEIESLRCTQGIRFYTMVLVILAHTIYILYSSLPVLNIKGIETLTDRFSAVFLTSGPLSITTFFMLSSFFLMHGILEHFKEQSELSFRTLLLIFFNRYIRLTPSLAAIILFQTTWLRHWGSGPNWNDIVGEEYLRCRKNGWKNILYINNVHPEDMCLHTTWYLALDTQYFAIMLLLIWFIKKYEKYIWLTLGLFLSISIAIAFYHNYENDFPAIMIPTPELLYGMKHTLKNKQWHIQYIGFFENISGSIIGLGVGYLYFKHKEQRIFTNKFHILILWVVSHVFGYGTVIIPGVLSLSKNIPHDIFWASISSALSRPLFAVGMSTAYFGMTQGHGGIPKRILEWKPLYILGRLTYTAYLVHIPLLLLKAGMIMSPVYFNEYTILFDAVGTITMTYLVAVILTLLFELPMSELQKLIISPKSKTKSNKEK